jgi:hypothetical protein
MCVSLASCHHEPVCLPSYTLTATSLTGMWPREHTCGTLIARCKRCHTRADSNCTARTNFEIARLSQKAVSVRLACMVRDQSQTGTTVRSRTLCSKSMRGSSRTKLLGRWDTSGSRRHSVTSLAGGTGHCWGEDNDTWNGRVGSPTFPPCLLTPPCEPCFSRMRSFPHVLHQDQGMQQDMPPCTLPDNKKHNTRTTKKSWKPWDTPLLCDR